MQISPTLYDSQMELTHFVKTDGSRQWIYDLKWRLYKEVPLHETFPHMAYFEEITN